MNSELQNCQQTEPCTVEEIRNSLEQSEKGKVYKAGYSPKFRSEHEADILLHQAAKQAFDQLNVKKLPKMKALQAEYAALLAEKKEAYAELRKARDEAQELLIVKANVDRILQNTERGGNAQEKGTVSFAANCALY